MENETFNFASFGLIVALMLIGAGAHWFKKKRRGEVVGSLLDYIVADSPKNSVWAGGSILGTAVLVSATGAAGLVDPRILWETIMNTGGLPAVQAALLGGALSTGWAYDSGLNKGNAGEQ